MKNLILVILLSLGLTGCAFGPKYNTLEVKETEVKVVKIQEELLVPCIPEKPFNKEEYLKLQIHKREQYLTDYSIGLLGTIKDCNIKLKKIRDIQDKQ